MLRLSLCLIVSLGASCAVDPESVVTDWEEEGWSRIRTHGVKREAVRHGKLESEQAQSIEVSWIERGKRKTKLYPQSTHYYAALRFFCEDGDEFVIVMRKRK